MSGSYQLMNIIKRLIFGPAAAYRWVKALDYAAEGRITDASRLLEKAEPYLAGGHEFHLFNSYICLATNRYAECAKELDLAIAILSENKKIKYADRKYLEKYASDLRIIANRRLSGERYVLENTKKNEINVNQVSKHLRRKFPLPGPD